MFIYPTMAYHYYNVTTRTNYPPLILVLPLAKCQHFSQRRCPPYQKCSSVINDKVLLWSHPPPVPPHSKCKRCYSPQVGQIHVIFGQIHFNIWTNTFKFHNMLWPTINVQDRWLKSKRLNLEKYILLIGQIFFKHCQRHNGPRNWLRDLD